MICRRTQTYFASIVFNVSASQQSDFVSMKEACSITLIFESISWLKDMYLTILSYYISAHDIEQDVHLDMYYLPLLLVLLSLPGFTGFNLFTNMNPFQSVYDKPSSGTTVTKWISQLSFFINTSFLILVLCIFTAILFLNSIVYTCTLMNVLWLEKSILIS